MAVRLRAVVHGDVQGVGFRDFVSRRAAELGLSGWVRNRADGTVECLAEGNRGALDDFLERLQGGPATAEVQCVEARWEPADGRLRGFEVRF